MCVFKSDLKSFETPPEEGSQPVVRKQITHEVLTGLCMAGTHES